jgi:hypothetical protein
MFTLQAQPQCTCPESPPEPLQDAWFPGYDSFNTQQIFVVLYFNNESCGKLLKECALPSANSTRADTGVILDTAVLPFPSFVPGSQ